MLFDLRSFTPPPHCTRWNRNETIEAGGGGGGEESYIYSRLLRREEAHWIRNDSACIFGAIRNVICDRPRIGMRGSEDDDGSWKRYGSNVTYVFR